MFANAVIMTVKKNVSNTKNNRYDLIIIIIIENERVQFCNVQ